MDYELSPRRSGRGLSHPSDLWPSFRVKHDRLQYLICDSALLSEVIFDRRTVVNFPIESGISACIGQTVGIRWTEARPRECGDQQATYQTQTTGREGNPTLKHRFSIARR